MPEEPRTVFYHKWMFPSALNGLCRVCVVAECVIFYRMFYYSYINSAFSWCKTVFSTTEFVWHVGVA
jgi:hypothetical protein